LSESELFDSVGSADVDVNNWSVRLLFEGINLVLNWHVPREELPDPDW